MCAPVAMVAMGILSSVTQYAAASQQASMQEATYQANKQNAEAALRSDYAQLNQRAVQEGEKKTAESRELAIKQARAISMARLSAGEAGITGLSVENISADISRQADNEEANRQYNYRSTITQLGREGTAAQAKAHGRILSVPRGVKPSPFTLVAGIGSSFLKGMS